MAKDKIDWIKIFAQRKDLILSDTFLANYNDTTTSDNRKARSIKDYDYFCRTYFSHLCSSPSAPFHIKAANDILKNPRFRGIFEWARGLAKSTHISLIIPLWLMLAHNEKLCLIITSKSEEMADRLLAEIQGELTTNELLRQDYPELVQIATCSEGVLTTTAGTLLYSCGRGQSPRGVKLKGLRPNYIVIDDIDDDELCRNDKRVRDVYRWCNEALFGTMAVGRGRFICVGNRIGKISVLGLLADNPTYKHSKVNILNNRGESSWAENYTLEEIENLRLSQGERSFQREYMNNPITEGTIFTNESIRYGAMLPFIKYKQLICYTDPSWKSSATSDYKATVLVGKTKEGYYHLLKVFAAQTSVTDMIQWLYNIQAYVDGKVPVFYYMEANMLQQIIVDQIHQYGKEHGDIIPVRGDHRKKPDKFARIEALEPLFSQGMVIFNEKEKDSPGMRVLVEQMLSFERGSRIHDDAPDALEGGIWLLNRKWGTGDSSMVRCSNIVSSRKY